MTTTDPFFGWFLALSAGPGQQVSPLIQLLPFAIVLAIFYFVIMLPMKNRQKKVQEFLAALKEGDKVVTYCHIGMQASALYLAARILGYDAAVYDGAWEEWSRKAELPVIGPAKP